MGTAMWEQVKDLNTAATQPWDPARLFRCDPYLVWADAATREPRPPAPSELPDPKLPNPKLPDPKLPDPKLPPPEDRLDIAVLVELKDASGYLDFLKRMNQELANLTAIRFLPNGFEPHHGSRFITGLVNRKGLAELVDEVAVTRLIERFSLQDSRLGIGRPTQKGWADYLNALKAEKSDAPSPPRPTRTKAATGTYLGIIDDGLPVLRVRDAIQFIDQPAHFWDQGWQSLESMGSTIGIPSPHDPYWRIAWQLLISMVVPAPAPAPGPVPPIVFAFKARGFLYGRRLKPLPRSLAAGASDRNEYTAVRYFHPAPRRSHGAGVLGLLAPWLSDARHAVEWPEHISGLAMVQLPTPTVMDTSGGSLAMRVIDGLRFILWQEQEDRPDPKRARPIVANISYGVHAGPHDGTSMFERALFEMLEDNPRLHVVLPAGNAAQAGCHARRQLAQKGDASDSASFWLEVLPDNSRDTFVELWLPAGASVLLAIRPPGSKEVYRVIEGEARICFEPQADDPKTPHRVRFGAVYSSSVAQGTEGTMVLVAIGSTQRQRPDGGFARGLNQRKRREVAGYSGLWELQVQNLAAHPITVDARVERGDAPPDAPAGSRQAFFPDSCDETVRIGNAAPDMTLNGIATLTHPRLHVVGAMRADGALSDYSAAGPTRPPATRTGPDVVVPADTSRNLPGLRTLGFVHGATGRINGTSAACAVFARALAEQLADDPTKPPTAPKPDEPPPEVSCVTDSQPEAPAGDRGQAVRAAFRFAVDLYGQVVARGIGPPPSLAPRRAGWHGKGSNMLPVSRERGATPPGPSRPPERDRCPSTSTPSMPCAASTRRGACCWPIRRRWWPASCTGLSCCPTGAPCTRRNWPPRWTTRCMPCASNAARAATRSPRWTTSTTGRPMTRAGCASSTRRGPTSRTST